MLTTKNNDILFDDLLAIKDQSMTFPVMYGDCDNRFEVETTEKLIQNGDCNN